MASNSSWRIDDMDGGLDGGLASELLNLSGLGNEFGAESRAYNMSDVLNLSLFKDEPAEVFQNIMDTVDATSVARVTVEATSTTSLGTPTQGVKQERFLAHNMAPSQSSQISSVRGLGNGQSNVNNTDSTFWVSGNLERGFGFCHVLRVPTSPTKRLEEDSLTYLNQGQSYLVELKCLPDTASEFDGQYLKGVVKLSFYERKLHVQESEKYEEWKLNRPADRILEIDVPMSSGVYNIRSKGSLLNSYEFEWDPQKETKLYVIINCVSSEFTKGKSGGESGVPFRLQVDTFSPSSSADALPIHSSACQVKVFKSKGADRKHKSEMQKLEFKSKDELDQLRPSFDCTELKEIPVNNEEDSNSSWMSPRGMGSITSPSQANTVVSPSNILSSPSIPPASVIPCNGSGLTSESTVDETRAWLQNNRFQNYLTMFANYTGSDILRLTKQDMVQIMGPADGIRLHNSLQARAARPLLTIYICLESAQQNSGMKEYHAMFLEGLNLAELRKKLAFKCNLSAEQIVAIYRQGPTGIYVLVDDEMVRNFMDEGHFILQLVREEGNTYQVVLK